MRQAFVHEATLDMPRGDERAPGAAVTVALCGQWEHPPPCPLAAHHTGVERAGDMVDLRVLFAAEPDREAEVRARIAGALAGGRLVGPDGVATVWRLRSERPGTVAPAEADHAARLCAG